MKKWILLLPLTFIIFSFDFTNVFTKKTNHIYTNKINGKSFETIWSVENKKNGFFLEGKDEEGITQIFCTKSFIIKRLNFKSTKEDTSYSFSRSNGTLACGGKVKGKQMQKKLQLGNNSWIQQFGYGLQPFSKSKNSKCKFYTVNPNNFSLVSMVATKEGIETLVIGKTSYNAQKIKISLTGMKSMFWSANIWFDSKTHLFLRYEGNDGPNTPTTIITYKGEK